MAIQKNKIIIVVFVIMLIVCFGAFGCANNANESEGSPEPESTAELAAEPAPAPTPTSAPTPEAEPTPGTVLSIDFLQGVWVDSDYEEEVPAGSVRYVSVYVIKDSMISCYELDYDGNEMRFGGLLADEDAYPLIDDGQGSVQFEWTYRGHDPEDVWFTYIDDNHIEWNHTGGDAFPLMRTNDPRILDVLETSFEPAANPASAFAPEPKKAPSSEDDDRGADRGDASPEPDPEPDPEPEETLSIDFLQGVWVEPDYEDVPAESVRYVSVYVVQGSMISCYELRNDGTEISFGNLAADEDAYHLIDDGQGNVKFEWTYRGHEPEDVWFTYVDDSRIEWNRSGADSFPLIRTNDPRILKVLEDY